jgi:Trp operon repressor
MRKPASKVHLKDLAMLFASVRSPREAEMLLGDIATSAERAAFAERWQLIQLLASGMTQRDVARKLGLSISKVTRGSKALQEGTGAFELFLGRLKKNR